MQNRAMRVIGGFLRTTPIHVMEAELNLQPLSIRRFYLANKYLLKIKSLSSNVGLMDSLDLLFSRCAPNLWRRKSIPLLAKIQNDWSGSSITPSIKLEMFSLDMWVSKIDLSDVLCMNVESINQAKDHYSSDSLKQICTTYLDGKFNNFYQIYTDGSKNHNLSGAAVFDPQTHMEAKFKIEARVSIMHVELLAIAEALFYISNILFDKFVILSDSKSALQHLARCSSTFRGLPIAYQIIKTILNIKSQNKTIKIQWIPSHVGINGNEKADQLADMATYEGVLRQVSPFWTD